MTTAPITPDALATSLALCGAFAGLVVAWLSVRLPGDRPRPGIRRLALAAIACAALGAWSGLARQAPVEAAIGALLGWQLLLLAIVDAENFWLPDALTLPLAASGLLAAVILPDRGVTDAIVGAVAGFAALWLLAFVYRRLRGRDGLGGGDPFMLAGAGAWVGWIGLPSVLLWAAVGGLSVVLARAMTGRKVEGADRLPFGVFLAIGLWLTWLLGPLGLWR